MGCSFICCCCCFCVCEWWTLSRCFSHCIHNIYIWVFHFKFLSTRIWTYFVYNFYKKENSQRVWFWFFSSSSTSSSSLEYVLIWDYYYSYNIFFHKNIELETLTSNGRHKKWPLTSYIHEIGWNRIKCDWAKLRSFCFVCMCVCVQCFFPFSTFIMIIPCLEIKLTLWTSFFSIPLVHISFNRDVKSLNDTFSN